MRVPNKQMVRRLLLMLCVIFCICLLLTRPGVHNIVPIPHGMKVVTVPVSDETIPDIRLLHPGCIVTVKATWTLNRSRIPEIIPDFIVNALIKCKLIKNNRGIITRHGRLYTVQVLSIKRSFRRTFVNLVVDPNQAEALSLAEKNGSISLTVHKLF